MAQYIDKDALVAEIERRKNLHFKIYAEEGFESLKGKYVEDKHILSFITSLEVKEVNLEKALDDYVYQEGLVNCYEIAPIAKHFFELGLKAQKGE